MNLNSVLIVVKNLVVDNSFFILDPDKKEDGKTYLCNICHFKLNKDGECERCTKTYLPAFNPMQQPSKIDVKGSKSMLTSNTNRQFGNDSDFIGESLNGQGIDWYRNSKEKKKDDFIKMLEDSGKKIIQMDEY